MEKLTDGYVKGVLSGDLIIISGKLKKGDPNDVPEEKNLFLTFVQSPKTNSQTTYEEDPLGWECRDFLRRLLIGKVIKYSIDYKNNETNFAQVFLDGKNINIEVVKAGYGSVKVNKSNEAYAKGAFFEKIKQAEADAQKNKLGLWKDNISSLPKRKILKQDETDAQELFKKLQGKTVDGIVEVIFNCGTMLILLQEPHNVLIKASLRFVALPSKNTEYYASGKAYAERLFAHRDCKVKIIHLDDRNFVVDVWDVRKNNSGQDETKNLALSVLSSGYSKLYVSSAFSSDKSDTDAAKNAQTQAQQAGLRVWEGFIPKKEKVQTESSASDKKVANFEGIVYIVHSGDSMTIKAKDGTLHRVFLSHIKAPTFAKPMSSEEDKPWAWQAKEYLRKTHIGSKVKAIFDYSKDINEKSMNFFSVIKVVDDKEVNINKELLENGYALYVAPKQSDTNVSKFIDEYAEAERTGKSAKKGVHSTRDPGNPNYCDLIQSNPKKKKEYIGRNANLGKGVPCVVEHCFSCFRYKLRIPQTSCYIPFKLLGLKGAEKDPNNTKQLNDLFDQSLDFVNEKFMQREGVVDVIQHDKNGNYFGYLTVTGTNVAAELLKEGFAIVHNPQNIPLPDSFAKLEAKASQSNAGIWKHQGLNKIIKDSDVINQDSSVTEAVPKDELVKVRVTDMISFNHFYCNILPNKSLTQIEKTLAAYDDGNKKAKKLDPPIKKGTLCLLHYINDGKHYRVIITAILKDEQYEVDFIDYGTIDIVSKDHLFKMDDSIATIAPQVVECELANMKFSKNSKKKAFEMYPDFIDLEKIHPARITYSYSLCGKTKLGLVIYDESNSLSASMQGELLSRGFAKIDEKKPLPKSVSELKEIERKAKSTSVGMWKEMEESDNEEDN